MSDTISRPRLGHTTDLICLKSMIFGVEEIVGPEAANAVAVSAGRRRGKQVAEKQGVAGTKTTPDQMKAAMVEALGENGTHLCIVESIQPAEGGYLVDVSETVCSADESIGSPRRCTYTKGVLLGVIEAVQGDQYNIRQTGSVLAGDSFDSFLLTPIQGDYAI